MARLGFLAVLYSLEALHDDGKPERAKKLIKDLIAEAKPDARAKPDVKKSSSQSSE